MRITATDVILLVKITAVTINLFVSRPLEVVREATPTVPSHRSVWAFSFPFLLQLSRAVRTASVFNELK